MSTVNLYLVRHGQTYLNKYSRVQGWADSELTSKGIVDATDAGKRLSKIKFDKAYSSDTKRATKTAELILEENISPLNKPIQMKGLREENFGYFEGNDANQTWHIVGGPKGANTYNEMIRMFSIEKTHDMIADADPYGDAENDSEYWKRIKGALDEIVETAKDGQNILVADHGTTIRSIVSRFSNIDVSQSILNGSVTKLVYSDGKFTVEYYNKISN